MASGFLILPDGRCFSRRWTAHDAVLRVVANHLGNDPAARPLHQWLLEQLPGPNDQEELGYGAWFRNSDQQIIVRKIDLRQMTAESQRQFCAAVKRASLNDHSEEWLKRCVADLADMVARFERGEPPLSKSDWREVMPPEVGSIGPGRDAA